MVYRFKPSERKYEAREKKPYRRAGADSPRRLYGYRKDEIDLSMLFELSKLEGAKKDSSHKIFFARLLRGLKKSFRVVSKNVQKAVASVHRALVSAFLFLQVRLSIMLEKRRARRKAVSDLYILAGALTAVTVVAFISFFAVLMKLIILDYFGHHEKITVPDMVGMSYNEAREALPEEYYNITVSYEYSSSIPAGTVISQYPSGGVERKIFSGGSLCTLSMVVSRGKEMLEINDFVGERERDAALELKNAAFTVVTVEEFSTSVPRGSVISTTPAAGEMLEVGGIVVLKVSRGRQKVMLTVPSLIGLTEAEASAKITSAGFSVGQIDYKSSDDRAGVVISQSVAARTRAEKGNKISFSVSAGREFSDKTVPSLYGLSIDEARKKLADCGLVCGNIYTASSTEPKGTVIAQSPSAGSALSPSLVSVDMYVSS